VESQKDDQSPNISELIKDTQKIESAMHDTIVNAMRVHKFFRIPWVTWKDGKVFSIPPEEIPVSEADFDTPPRMPNW
jgi:hypothetical protein